MKKTIFILLGLCFLAFSGENTDLSNSNIEIEDKAFTTNCFPQIDQNLTFFYKVNFDSDKNTFEIQKETRTLLDYFYDDSFQSLNKKVEEKDKQN